jgi:hypothetical protein
VPPASAELAAVVDLWRAVEILYAQAWNVKDGIPPVVSAPRDFLPGRDEVGILEDVETKLAGEG